MHLRPDDEIHADIRPGILRPLAADGIRTVRAAVRDGVVTLTGRVDRWSTTDLVGRLTRQVGGVVDVVDQLEYDYDDRDILGTGMAYGVA